MKIAVIGTGYVGLVTGGCFAEVGHYVTCVDINEEKIDNLQKGISPIFEPGLEELIMNNLNANRLFFTCDIKGAIKDAEIIFVGVGTPENEDGSANLSYIYNVFTQLAEILEKDCIIVIKSTVPVGTNDSLEEWINCEVREKGIKVEIVSNPEFLAQGNAINDTLSPSRIVIGTDSLNAIKMLNDVYAPFNAPIITVSRASAEMIKYASNDFLALKISYINDIANLCELVGADIQDVAKGMSYDDRIGNKFLNAGIGFGGSCFPKDTKALAFLGKQHGYLLNTVEATIQVNHNQKTKLFYRAINRIGSFNKKKVAILGLTFKPGTDDIREAASIENVRLLLEQGADIYAYDPIGISNYSKLFPEGTIGNGKITYCEIDAALYLAEVCFVFTEWREIKVLTPKRIKELMLTPLVYDGRNIFDVPEMKREGIEYYSIGR
jgi:UDPglucose 6-dehydrogenase